MLLKTKDDLIHEVVTHVLPNDVINRHIIVTDDSCGYDREFHEIIDRLWNKMGTGLGWYAIWDHEIRREFGVKESIKRSIFSCGNTIYIREKE